MENVNASMMGDAATIEQKVSELFKSKEFSTILSLLNDPENHCVIENSALSLVARICSEIKSQEEILLNPSYAKLCLNILMLFVDKANPKEVLLSLLEAADCINEDEFFILLLIPIQKTLIKVPGKRGASLDWVLNILNAHFCAIPWPENQNFEGEELMLLDLDKNVQRTAGILSEYVYFFKPFVEEVVYESKLKVVTSHVGQQRTILQKYLLNLLCRPLVYQDMHIISGRPMSSIQVSCQKVLEFLGQLSKNFCNLHKLDFKNTSLDTIEEDLNCDNVFDLAFGNVGYLIFVENLSLEFHPFIYAPSYLFENYVPIIICMLSRKEYLVLYKALHLCKALLEFDFELSTGNLPLTEFVKLSLSLANIAVYCTVESYRCLSATLFISYIKKFSWEDRYFMLLSIINKTDIVGVQGLVIDMYKDFLHQTKTDESNVKYFVGKNLHQFLKPALLLKDDVKTDILENFQKIISGLNLVRYLILADSKDNNVTGIYNVIENVKATYLEPLQLGIDISKAHYQLEAKNIDAEKSIKMPDVNATLTVGDEVLPNLSPENKKDIIQKSLISLDLIQSILSRVLEIVDQKVG